MSYQSQQNQPSPPPAYNDTIPGAMESEVYIDGTLYVDGVPVGQGDKQKKVVKQSQMEDSYCKKAVLLVRSNIFSVYSFHHNRI